MIVLDTNIVSELMRPEPASTVLAWLREQPGDDLYTTAITTHAAILATRNTKDFVDTGIHTTNPWQNDANR